MNHSFRGSSAIQQQQKGGSTCKHFLNVIPFKILPGENISCIHYIFTRFHTPSWEAKKMEGEKGKRYFIKPFMNKSSRQGHSILAIKYFPLKLEPGDVLWLSTHRYPSSVSLHPGPLSTPAESSAALETRSSPWQNRLSQVIPEVESCD